MRQSETPTSADHARGLRTIGLGRTEKAIVNGHQSSPSVATRIPHLWPVVMILTGSSFVDG